MGGDEFLVVLVGDDLAKPLGETANRLMEIVSEPIETADGVHFVSASVGSALGTVGDDFAKLVATADAEMYKVKRLLRGR
jgi:diguanylate cyclase (GGDEF)-like protein